jgi:hypothetical protein
VLTWQRRRGVAARYTDDRRGKFDIYLPRLGVEKCCPCISQCRLRKARLSLRSRNQAHGTVRDFVGPSVARNQAVENGFSTACQWLARYNTQIFGPLYVASVAYAVVRYLGSA